MGAGPEDPLGLASKQSKLINPNQFDVLSIREWAELQHVAVRIDKCSVDEVCLSKRELSGGEVAQLDCVCLLGKSLLGLIPSTAEKEKRSKKSCLGYWHLRAESCCSCGCGPHFS